MEHYDIIANKIHKFIRKYYLGQTIKGLSLMFVFFIVISFILLFAENNSYFLPKQKLVILISYLLVLAVGIVVYVVVPLLGFIGVANRLSEAKINDIIVAHFSEIKDSLWNLMELRKNKQELSQYSQELVEASIDQKIEKLKVFDFQEAVNLKSNLRFIYFFVTVLVVAIIVTIAFNETIRSSSERLIDYKTSYEKPSPYTFVIENESMKIGKGDDLTIVVAVESSEIVEHCNIIFGGNTYMMVSSDSSKVFRYKFANINNSIDFNFRIGEYDSKIYTIEVLEKPVITSFAVNIEKPSYTNLQNQRFENLAEIMVPVGSNCTFTFNTYETDSLIIRTSTGERLSLGSAGNGKFVFARRYKSPEELTISIKNLNFENEDLFKINIETIKDDYPSIVAQQIVDSAQFTTSYFKGVINDDYGFHKLTFTTKINNQIDSVYQLNFSENALQQPFYFAYDFLSYKEKAKEVVFYFEVFDNDQVNGYKSSISEQFLFVFPDTKEIFEKQDNQYADIEQLLNDSRRFNQDIQKELLDLQQKLINNELSDWEKKEAVKSIMDSKKRLENAVKDLQEKNNELNNYMESFTDQDSDILEKQQQIQELLDQVFSDELKKLMDEFSKLAQEFNPDKMNDLKKKMEISLDDLGKQLDKNLEMLKQMQMEQKVGLINDKLNEIAEKQDQIINELENGSKNAEEAKLAQEELKKEIEELEKEYNEVKKANDELEEPMNMLDFKNEFDEMKKEFDNSTEQLDKNKKKPGAESMKKNSDNMKNLAFMMQQMMDMGSQEKKGENLEDMIQILHNLVTLSFNQEEIIKIPANNFFVGDVLHKQKEIKDQFQIIQDSLYALAKREPAITTVVNEEIVTIQNHLGIIETQLSDGNNSIIKSSQQYVLTSINNLSLFMSEVIKQMQKQMANSTPGDKNCKNPGGKNPNSSSKSSMKQQQQSMQQQLEKLMQMMKEGAGSRAINNELGKALGQQEMMQEMLRQMMNENTVGSDAYETLKKADQLMEQIKQDIMKKNITNETLNRQKNIMTRLLEAENADNERGQEERRKSNTSEKQFFSNPANYFDNKNLNNNFEERLMKNKLMLQPFYQSKYQDYINQLDSLDGKTN